MRIVKEHDERKNEIIRMAAALFAEKGYDKCSVNDILNAVGIAKGTFYYYFKSKEEVLDAAIDLVSEQVMEKVNKVVDQTGISPVDRVIQVLLATRVTNPTEEVLIQEMHKTENALLHQKTLLSILTMLTPVLTEILEEGNRIGAFHCAYPEQSVQILLSASLTLLDDGIFHVEKEQAQKLFEALVSAMEKILGVEEGTFFTKMKEDWTF
ncbi:MAG: TetR/AcrR family transcriptional regulator [Bariatricus sp.]